MMQVLINHMNIEDKRKIANAAADTVKLKANIDYLAMMSDIDIPVEDESEDKHDE